MVRISAEAWADLNNAQRAAVEHGDAPLLVIAGAGSGKTKTLSCRVAHLVAQGVDPSRILLLTFSRRAASEEERGAGGAEERIELVHWASTLSISRSSAVGSSRPLCIHWMVMSEVRMTSCDGKVVGSE